MNLTRTILVHICADGTVTYRKRMEPVFNNAALPIMSVDTVEEAESLQVLMCKAQYVEHPQMPGKTWYRYVPFGGTFDDIPAAAEAFESAYGRMKRFQNRKISA